MQQNAAFPLDLHCLLRQTIIKERKYNLNFKKNRNFDFLIYTTDRVPIRESPSQFENGAGELRIVLCTKTLNFVSWKLVLLHVGSASMDCILLYHQMKSHHSLTYVELCNFVKKMKRQQGLVLLAVKN